MTFLDKYKLMFFIAFTQLRAKKVQTFVATISVTFGIAVFIYIVGYIKGVNQFVNDVTLLETADVRLFIETESKVNNVVDKVFSTDHNLVHHVKPRNKQLHLKDGRLVSKDLQSDIRISTVSPSVKTQVYYHIGSNNINGVITGIDLMYENQMFNLDKKLIEGNFDNFSSIPNSLVMGEKLRARLNLQIGDKIRITTEKGHSATGILIATVKTGIPEIDKTLCYASDKTVQNLIGVPSSYITEIKIKLHDATFAPQIAAELGKKYDYNYSDWQIDNAALFEGAELQDMIFNCIAMSILFIAGFGIFNILNMMIYEKMKDISIIKAIGFSNKDVRTIFMTQALFIGLIGGITGVLLGFLLSFVTSLLPYESDVFVTTDHLPMNFSQIYYLIGLLFALLTTFFAGYLPSRKASRLDPVTILRG